MMEILLDPHPIKSLIPQLSNAQPMTPVELENLFQENYDQIEPKNPNSSILTTKETESEQLGLLIKNISKYYYKLEQVEEHLTRDMQEIIPLLVPKCHKEFHKYNSAGRAYMRKRNIYLKTLIPLSLFKNRKLHSLLNVMDDWPLFF
ncbi:uncharacterized protein EV154DRAFT_572140 [Mucor mucedo]|uniref:uncharacterized protein n=1 Tax=Mucor mucedo TaxID=29922 RepID=UPI00221F5B25|nr:uncharacterized protein EV154DRAFT_572140 [Mucor mucedo]KAI7865554.1 hypothetical protein EV154DRAFT_572140 [Mucor mucedo]